MSDIPQSANWVKTNKGAIDISLFRSFYRDGSTVELNYKHPNEGTFVARFKTEEKAMDYLDKLIQIVAAK